MLEGKKMSERRLAAGSAVDNTLAHTLTYTLANIHVITLLTIVLNYRYIIVRMLFLVGANISDWL